MNIATARYVVAILKAATTDAGASLDSEALDRAVVRFERDDIDRIVPGLGAASDTTWSEALCYASALMQAGIIPALQSD